MTNAALQIIIPDTACPIISKYVRVGIVHMPAHMRHQFQPFAQWIAESHNPMLEPDRAGIFALAALRRFAPLALEAIGLHRQAARLRALSDLGFHAATAIEDVAASAKMAGNAQVVGCMYSAAHARANAAAQRLDLAATEAVYAAGYAASAADAGAVWREYMLALDEALLV
jgi:hypothetical protein